MEKFYRVYAKSKDMKRFKAVDLATGNVVNNLIRATMVPEWQLLGLQEYIKIVQKEQPELEFKIEKIK